MVIVLAADNFYTDDNTYGFSVRAFAEGLARRGHEIRVIAYDEGLTGIKHRDGSFETCFVSRLSGPDIAKAVSGADVVHIFQLSMLGRTVYKAARRSGIPVMAGFYTQPENMIRSMGLGRFVFVAHIIYLLWRWLFYRNFLHIHCLSKPVAAQLRSHGYKAWLHVLPIDQDKLKNSMIRIENMYSSISGKQNRNEYAKGLLFKLFSRLFHAGFAVPLMQFMDLLFLVIAGAVSFLILRKGSSCGVLSRIFNAQRGQDRP